MTIEQKAREIAEGARKIALAKTTLLRAVVANRRALIEGEK